MAYQGSYELLLVGGPSHVEDGNSQKALPLLPKNNPSFSDGYSFQENSKVWTLPAKIFFLCISLFVLSTVGMLVALEISNVTTFEDRRGSPAILQPQAIVSEIFLVIVAYFAIRSRNMIHIIAVLCFNVYLAILRHPGLQKPESKHMLALVWAIPAVDLTFHFGCDWAAWRLYQELGWYAYKKVSGNLRLRQLYRRFLILTSLLVLSGYFSAPQTWTLLYSTLIMYSIILNKTSFIPEGVVGLVLFIFVWTLYMVGITLTSLAIRREAKKMIKIGLGLQVFYLLCSIAEIGLHGHAIRAVSPLYDGNPLIDTTLLPIRTIFQTLVAFSLAVATLVYSILVGNGFGKGLKELYPTAAILHSERIDLSID